MSRLVVRSVVASLIVVCTALAGEAPKTYGWRGNWTGLYPEANPPTEWGRIAKGVVAGMSCQAAKPAPNAAEAPTPITTGHGFIRDWLVLGLLPVTHSINDFDKEQIPGETKLAPVEGDLAWKPVAVNRIETVVDRGWAWAPQEILANGPPVFDGNRIYLRGENFLYCIGEK